MKKRTGPLLPVFFLLLACAACGKRDAAAEAGITAAPEEAPPPAMDARETQAWARAGDGGAEEEMRLADLVGCTGLRERASAPRLRATALRAMAYCSDFSELPFLAAVATDGSDEDATAALDAVVEQAAAPRRAVDPEDAAELGEGCHTLLALAQAKDRPRTRRAKAVSALRMLSERGCVKRAEIPTNVDAK